MHFNSLVSQKHLQRRQQQEPYPHDGKELSSAMNVVLVQFRVRVHSSLQSHFGFTLNKYSIGKMNIQTKSTKCQ